MSIPGLDDALSVKSISEFFAGSSYRQAALSGDPMALADAFQAWLIASGFPLSEIEGGEVRACHFYDLRAVCISAAAFLMVKGL